MVGESGMEEEVARHVQRDVGVGEEMEHLEEDTAVLVELADGSEAGAVGVEKRVAGWERRRETTRTRRRGRGSRRAGERRWIRL